MVYKTEIIVNLIHKNSLYASLKINNENDMKLSQDITQMQINTSPCYIAWLSELNIFHPDQENKIHKTKC